MIFSVALLVVPVAAQTAEVKITLSEQFFDALLEAVFTNLKAPSVPLTSGAGTAYRFESERGGPAAFPETGICDEAVVLKKEVDGVRTAVRFRQGKIYVPIAFQGTYNPPLVGCIEFQGWAETNIELSFDKKKNAIVGNAKVLNVNLSGTGGLGSNLIARMVQASIDRKINPIEIISLEKLSFTVPVRDSGNLQMRALGMRHVVAERALEIFINYEFRKA